MQLGCHPVAVIQYTFTHKQYTERPKTKKYIEQHKHLGRVRAVPRLGELYPGICLTTEEKARKSLIADDSLKSCIEMWCSALRQSSPHLPITSESV
jgi:hypothetical protein